MISKEILKKVRQIQIFTQRTVTNLFSGEYESAFKGNGMEFEEVREYLPGDDIRSIDWNVTARTNVPHIKRFKEERELTVYFLVDLSGSGNLEFRDKSRNEFSAEIVTVLSFAANINNDKTGLIVFTDDIELHVPPAKGLRHVLRMTRELLVLKPRSNKTSVKTALEHVSKVADRRAVIFLVSDFYDEDCSKEMKKVAAKHDLINIAVRDKRELELPDAGLINFIDPETGKTITIDSSSKRIRSVFNRNAVTRLNNIKKESLSMGAGFIPLIAQDEWVSELVNFFKRRENRRK